MISRLRLSRSITLLTVLLAALPSQAGAAGDWGINLYGLSYHWDRGLAKTMGWDNEFNPGLGLRYRLGPRLKGESFVDAGAYRDSGRNTALYAALGVQWPLDEHKAWWLGAAITAFNSDTYNQGDPFIAPIPLLSWRLEPVTLNLTHFPKFSGFNDIHTTAFFLTFPLP